MKKNTLPAAVAGCLLAAALNCSAFQEVAPPTPLPNGGVEVHIQTGDNVFVGQYGEVLRYDERWTAEPEMQGLIEVVRFHAQTRGRDKSGNLTFAPYLPRPQDYVPEKFAPMELAQLFVIPKNAPNGFSSLRRLRAAKERELAASGVGYRILSPSTNDLEWPQDTFFVSISTPYQLFQQYTQSDKNILIFTAGSNPFDRIQGPVGKISNSLRENLKQFQRQLSGDYRVYKYPIVSIPWILTIVISGALCLFPERRAWHGRFQLIGRATLLCSAGLPMLGLAAIELSWRHGYEKWINMGSVLFIVAAILPLLSAAISARIGGTRPGRVFLWMAAVNFLPAAAALALALASSGGQGNSEGAQFFGISLGFIFLSWLCGINFGLTHPNGEDRGTDDGASR